MASNSSQPSQVGLFSAQISEQIGRLRALTAHEADVEAADAVGLKRAVMATRLLAGSARILHLDSIQELLDRLLVWLQRVEEAQRPLTPSQSMILDSCIQLEEDLLRNLEENEDAPDLSGFDEDISDLLGLIDRNARALESARPDEEAPAPEAVEPDPRAGHLLEALGAVVTQLESLDAETGGQVLREPVAGHLGDLASRLNEILAAHGHATVSAATEASPPLEAPKAPKAPVAPVAPADIAAPEAPRPVETPVQPVEAPPFDAPAPRITGQPGSMADELAQYLRHKSEELGQGVDFEINGGDVDIAEGMREAVGEILQHLLDDAFRVFDQLKLENETIAHPTVGVDILEERGRLRAAIRDNGPRMGDAPALDDADPLGVYGGLRRSRGLIEQLNGLVQVEPHDLPDHRFVLSLPADLKNQTYRLIDLGSATVAVPWVLVVDVLSTDGLLFHADTSGESFEHHGQSISLVDMAEFSTELVPGAEMGDKIAIVGSVEKRLGVYCEEVREFVDAARITAATPGWEDIAYGGLEVGDRVVPLLDIKRLFHMRFGAGGGPEEAGSLRDPVLDIYVPTPAPEPVVAPQDSDKTRPVATLGPEPVLRRALLINQSDFRRRDLARSLEALGFEVHATAELIGGLHYLDGHNVDLVVTDLRLGDPSSDSLTRLREGRPRLPVVLTSSVAREYADQLADKTGADACWLEPYRSGDLQNLLHGLA